jgi:hypothetical protein
MLPRTNILARETGMRELHRSSLNSIKVNSLRNPALGYGSGPKEGPGHVKGQSLQYFYTILKLGHGMTICHLGLKFKNPGLRHKNKTRG